MGDLGNKQRSGTQRIVGSDEQFAADVELINAKKELLVVDKDNSHLLKNLINEVESVKNYFMLTNNDNVLRDGKGLGHKAKINKFGALKVFEQGIPDIDDPEIQVPITQFLRDVNGSQDMRIMASLANPTDFFVSADEDTDRYISTLSFLISDQNALLSNFGAINELTNGCQLILQTQELGETILADNLTTNYSFIRLCVNTIGISDNVSAYRADNISGNSEGYSCILNINSAFGTKFGLRLRAGTKDKLILRVRDNTFQIDAFDCLTYGAKLIN